MNLLKKWGTPVLWGMLYCVLVILLSQTLLRNLHILISWITAALNANTAAQISQSTEQIADTVFTSAVPQDTLTQIVQAAAQLRGAVLVSPWLTGLLAGGAIGLLMRLIFRKPKVRFLVSLILGILFLLPLVLLTLCFTEVNSIRLLDLLTAVLPLFL